MAITTVEKWIDDEPAQAEKQNRIFKQLKRFGSVPKEMGITVAMSNPTNTLNSATGNTFGTRQFGRGTYGA